MAKTPQSFEKRQRERRKQEKRAEKQERRLIRNEDKRRAKAGEDGLSVSPLDPDGLSPDGLPRAAEANGAAPAAPEEQVKPAEPGSETAP